MTRIAEANFLFVDSNVRIHYRLAGVQSDRRRPAHPTAATSFRAAPRPPARRSPGSTANSSTKGHGSKPRSKTCGDASPPTSWCCWSTTTPESIAASPTCPSWRTGSRCRRHQPALRAARFAVVEYDCGNPDFTFAHELGHTLGMRHENPARPRILLPWAYGHLFTRPSTNSLVATVMGCTPGFNACSRIGHFSNPDVLFEGVPTGRHGGASSAPAAGAQRLRRQSAGGAVPRRSPRSRTCRLYHHQPDPQHHQLHP